MDAHPKIIRRKVISLAWPIVIQNFLFTLMIFVDTLMVGRLGEVALAATGIAGPIMWAISSILMAIGIGTVATVSRSVGEKDFNKARIFAATSLVMGIIGGIIVSIPGALFSYRIVGLFIKDTSVIWESGSYIRIIFYSFVFNDISMISSSILRASGDTRTPMKVTILTNCLNVIGNYILIFGKFGMPALGLQGAGLSTAICKVIEGFLLTSHIFSKRSVLRLYTNSFKLISRDSLRTVFKISLPASLEPFLVRTGFLLFTRIVTSMGTLAIAAHRIAVAIESLSFMPGLAFSMACATLVGQKIGERSESGFRQSIKQSLLIAIFVMSSFGLLFLLIPGFLARLFTSEKNLIASAALCLMIGAFEQPFLGASMVFRGAFQGAGDTKTPLYVATLSVWGPRLVLSYLLGLQFGLGLAGIWIATTVDWLCRTILFFWRYNIQKHKFQEIVLAVDTKV